MTKLILSFQYDNTMEKYRDFLFFRLENQRFAIPLACVKKVLHVVEIRPLPKQPAFLHGIINYYGKVLPIINLHFLFSCASKTIELSDQLIVIRTAKVKFGLLVNKVLEVYHVDERDIKDSEPMMYGSCFMQGVIKNQEGIVLISDVDAFLDEGQLAEMAKVLASHATLKAE